MKIVFYSLTGKCAALAYRCLKEKHESYLYIKDEFHKHLLDGYVPKVNNLFEIHKLKPDLVIFDDTSMSDDADRLERMGIKSIGTSSMADNIVSDRNLERKISKDLGISMLWEQEFGSITEAITYLDSNPKYYTVEFEADKYHTYSSKNGSGVDMRRYLAFVQGKEPIRTTLKTQIYGIFVSVGMMFRDGEPIFPAYSTIFKTGALAGDVSIRTEPNVSMSWFYKIKEPRLVQIHKKMWPFIRQIKYSGTWEINFIVDIRGKIWFLNHVPKLNPVSIYSICELAGASMLFDSFTPNLNPCYTASISTYPYPTTSKIDHVRLKGLPVSLPDTVWPHDVMKFEGNDVIAGTSGKACSVSVIGKDIHEQSEKFKSSVKNITLPHMQYRNDGAYILWKEYKKLADMKII